MFVDWCKKFVIIIKLEKNRIKRDRERKSQNNFYQ